MARRRFLRRSLFRFDQPYLDSHGVIAGVDEAGRGPLAGPVVAAAVILPRRCRLPHLDDSKQLSALQRERLYALIQRVACAIGVGVVEPEEIDRVNIYRASFAAMRMALAGLVVRPAHVLVDGYRIPDGPASQTGLIEGDGRSAHIAAASVIAKVTRDCLMEAWHRHYPSYGFKEHKGYGTPRHLSALQTYGPCPIHRRSYEPVRQTLDPAAL